MFAHVLLLGRTSFQKLRLGFGLNPRGGISFAPVANINKAGRVIWYGLDPSIVNREEGLECRQTSKAFALIGFRC